MIRSSKVKRTVKRSALFHLIRTITPINHGADAWADFWGAAAVIGIVISGVLLMRSLLAVQ